MAKGMDRGNKEAKKPKKSAKTPVLKSEDLFSKGTQPASSKKK